MDLYDEEIRAQFIVGVDTSITILQAAIDKLKEARAAAVANDVAAAFEHRATTMEVLRDFVEQSKKDPKF